MRHHLRGLLGIVFAVLLIFITFVTSFEAVTYWTPNFYRDEFEHYQVLDDMQAWHGRDLVDRDGDKIGNVEHIGNLGMTVALNGIQVEHRAV